MLEMIESRKGDKTDVFVDEFKVIVDSRIFPLWLKAWILIYYACWYLYFSEVDIIAIMCKIVISNISSYCIDSKWEYWFRPNYVPYLSAFWVHNKIQNINN